MNRDRSWPVVCLALALTALGLLISRSAPVRAEPILRPALFLPTIARNTLAPLPSNAERARGSYAALRRAFQANDGTPLYRETWPPANPPGYAYHWSQAHVTALAMDLLPLVPEAATDLASDLQAALPAYWDTSAAPPGCASVVLPPFGPGGDKFYDDNAWTGLNLVRAYRLTRDAAYLDGARQVFSFIEAGWDADASHPAPGGVFWVQAAWNRDRNTVSNAPSAELGFRLYQVTGDRRYLDSAARMFDWVNRTLLDTDPTDGAVDGLYWDHINLQGVINKGQWSYNQGTMIGAHILLYEITGDGFYLARARRIATLALDFYNRVGYRSQLPPFNAIFFRHLLLLASADPTFAPLITQAMRSYADDVWRANRHDNGLFLFPAQAASADLVNQAALAEILALLTWDPARYDLAV